MQNNQKKPNFHQNQQPASYVPYTNLKNIHTAASEKKKSRN